MRLGLRSCYLISACVLLMALENSAQAQGQWQLEQVPVPSSMQLDVTPKLKTPPLKPVFAPVRQSDSIARTVKLYHWTAPGESYQNLLFEDAMLERQGYSRNETFQPLASGMKFYTAGFLFPLKAARRLHKQCQNPPTWTNPPAICR